jgi:hypothetical protein
MLWSKAPVTTHEWQFAQNKKINTICVKMMSALFQILIITCAN